MSFPNQITLKSAIADLKEVVTRLHGAETEPVRLLRQIEHCATEIESRANSSIVVVAAQTLVTPAAQALVNPAAQALVNPIAPTVII